MSYIVVEGPVGADKTSLSRMLAETLGASLLLEVVQENPLLAPYYQDPQQYAFKGQVFFLLSRYKQLQELSQGALFRAHTLSDCLFDKDFIFASLTLLSHEWELYQDLYRHLRPKLAEPEVLLGRIAQRGRPFEAKIQADYLAGASYDDFCCCEGPLTVACAERYDFFGNSDDRLRLARAA